jgi:cell division protein FtsW
MDFINKIFRGDRVIWVVFLLFCCISIVEVYSASSTLTFRQDYWQPISRHVMFLLGGLGALLLIHAIPARYFSAFGVVLLPFAWGLMLLALVLGEPVNESYRWVNLFGITFQPSEIAKICLICFVAFILSRRKEGGSNKYLKLIMIATFTTCGMIIIGGGGSTALLLFGVVILMMWIAQVPLLQIGKMLLYGIVGIALFIGVSYLVPADREPAGAPVEASIATPDKSKLSAKSIKKYLRRPRTWVERLQDFKNKENVNVNSPNFEINDDNFQTSHARIAIANGGVFGKIPGRGIERDFLPHAFDDFIYAIIIEETGLLGGLCVLLLYIILLVRSGIIAKRSDKLFMKYIVMGSALILTSQALVNMAVAVGLIPVTGQTLPLVSRGGTSILITCAYFGIILSVSRFNNPIGEEREETIIEEYNEDEAAAETSQSNS